MIREGDKAPGFTLPDQDGREVSLKDFSGRSGSVPRGSGRLTGGQSLNFTLLADSDHAVAER